MKLAYSLFALASGPPDAYLLLADAYLLLGYGETREDARSFLPNALGCQERKLANWRGSAMARSSEELPRLVYSASRKDGDVNSHSFAARTGLVPRVST